MSGDREKNLLGAPSEEAAFLRGVSLLCTTVDDIELGPQMGAGSFGRVYAARWKGANVAVKIIRHQSIGYASNQSVSTEAMVGRLTAHPNVVPIYSIFSRDLTPEGCIDPAAYGLATYLIMERADKGCLGDQLEKLSDTLKEEKSSARGYNQILRCLLDVAYGLEYLHSIGVVHGDLKPSNILCKSSRSDPRGYICKLGDFGLSSANTDTKAMYKAEKGAFLYCPPERLIKGSVTSSGDIYSFGILAWHILDSSDSQAHLSHVQLFHHVTENQWRPEFHGGVSEAYTDFVTSCWQPEPKLRPSIMQLRKSLTALMADSQHEAKQEKLVHI